MSERIGAIVIKDKALLLVTGFAEDAYWTPGGGKEEGETDEDALRRELHEELGVQIKSIEPYCDFVRPNLKTGEDMASRYYRVELVGDLNPSQEVTGYTWYTRENLERNEPKTLPSFASHLAPRLIADNLI